MSSAWKFPLMIQSLESIRYRVSTWMVEQKGSLLQVSYTQSKELGQDVRKAGPALEEASFKTTVTSPTSFPPATDLRLLFLCSCVLVLALIVIMMLLLRCTKFLSQQWIQEIRYRTTWFSRAARASVVPSILHALISKGYQWMAELPPRK